MQRFYWFLFAFFAIGVGIYPLAYLAHQTAENGLLAMKSILTKSNSIWHMAFYLHISFGGLSLLSGWSQFSKRFRSQHLNIHRQLGRIYLVSVLISGLSGFYIAIYATGGLIASLGFGFLAVFWLLTAYLAFSAILRKKIQLHKEWMMRSYALCFAAVTLRIWLPLSQAVLGMEFITAYIIISWLCWVPNLLFIELIIARKRKSLIKTA